MPELAAAALPKQSGLEAMGADIAREEQLYTRRSTDLAGKQAAISSGREAVLAPMEQKMSAALAEPDPQRPKSNIQQFKPEPIIDAKEYEALSYGLIAMAMLGGVASQGKWLEVGDVLNGALKGYMDGNIQVAKKRYTDYDEMFKGAMAQEAQANREFEDILRNKKMKIQDQISQYRVVAAKYDRQDALAAAESRSLDAMWRSIESRKTAMARLQDGHERASEMMDFRREMAESAAASKREASTGNAGISERYTADPNYKKQVDYWAKYMAQGNSLPPRFAQSGAGKMMFSDIVSVVPTLGAGKPGDMIANKLSIREMNSEAQKLGAQAAAVAIANKELMRFIPLAEKAIDDVPRTGWRPINQLIQAGENTWSPEQKALMIANRSVLNAFSQLIQRGAPTVHSMTEAESLINTADSPAVYKAAMKQLRLEGVQAEEGLNDAREELLKRARAIGGEEAPAAPGGGAAPAIPSGWSVKER